MRRPSSSLVLAVALAPLAAAPSLAQAPPVSNGTIAVAATSVIGGVAVDASGAIFVSNTATHFIEKYSPAGVLTKFWGGKGTAAGKFSAPGGLAIAPCGELLVADPGNNRIQAFDLNGTFLRQWGSLGANDDQFDQPIDVAVAPERPWAFDECVVYVLDRGNRRVCVWDVTGFLLRPPFGSAGGGPGQFNLPSALALGEDDDVYVCDTGNNRVQRLSWRGDFLGAWGTPGLGAGQLTNPRGIAVDSSRTVYVVDDGARVQRFSPDGAFLLQWGSSGSAAGQLNQPRVVTEGRGSDVVVWEQGNHRIQRFSPRVRIAPSDWFQDAFPFTETVVPSFSIAFDTAAAFVRTGRNNASLTGDLSRRDWPGTDVLIETHGPVTRVDMVFRVLPGPGDYVTVGNACGDPRLRGVPTSAVPVNQMDLTNFWAKYLSNNGPYGTNAVTHPGTTRPNGHPGTTPTKTWDPNVWNSAQCEDRGAGLFRTRDPATLLPILPDGILTPGAHVEYFFRIDDGVTVLLVPDTSRVLPQYDEVSFDAHRWQEFGVLPDAWKDPAFCTPLGLTGLARACVLVIDQEDGRGNEAAWVSTADTIGLTHASHWGAHNGWHALGGLDVNVPANNRTRDGRPAFVAEHVGQPGTSWDLYQVRGGIDPLQGAGSLGNRLAAFAGGDPPGRAGIGPTPAMLRTFYPWNVLLTGDMRRGVLGPSNDHSQDDTFMLTDYLTSGSSFQPQRLLWVLGDGFANSCLLDFPGPQYDLMYDYLGADLLDSYLYTSDYLEPLAGVTDYPPASSPTIPLVNNARSDPAVLDIAAGAVLVDTEASIEYVPSSPFPLAGGIYKRFDATKPWVGETDGFNLEDLRGPAGASTTGRHEFVYHRIKQILASGGSQCSPLAAAPLIALDVGGDRSAPGAPMIRVLENPIRRGTLRVQLSVPKDQRARVDVYDVGGRLVRTLFDGASRSARTELTWDLRDGRSGRIPAGVYFVAVRGGGGVTRQKFVVLE